MNTYEHIKLLGNRQEQSWGRLSLVLKDFGRLLQNMFAKQIKVTNATISSNNILPTILTVYIHQTKPSLVHLSLQLYLPTNIQTLICFVHKKPAKAKEKCFAQKSAVKIFQERLRKLML